jgi:hypothetical protein
VVWAGFLEEPLEVVHRQPGLMLVTMHSGRDAPHAEAAPLPIVAIIMVNRGHGSLRALHAPLFAALLSIVDDDVKWRLLEAAWVRLTTSLGWMEHDHLVGSGMLGVIPCDFSNVFLKKSLCSSWSGLHVRRSGSALVLPWQASKGRPVSGHGSTIYDGTIIMA